MPRSQTKTRVTEDIVVRPVTDLRSFGLPPYVWLLADEISARALCAGKVTARLQRQASDGVAAIDGLPVDPEKTPQQSA